MAAWGAMFGGYGGGERSRDREGGALGALAMRSASPGMRVLGTAGACALCSLVRANGGPLAR